jgi:hypothetical protein
MSATTGEIIAREIARKTGLLVWTALLLDVSLGPQARNEGRLPLVVGGG